MKTALPKFTEILLWPLTGSVDGATHGVAANFAMIALAGEVATNWNLTGWEKHAALNAAQTLFEACVEGRAVENDPAQHYWLTKLEFF